MKENNFSSERYTRKDHSDGSITFTPKKTKTEIFLSTGPTSLELIEVRFKDQYGDSVNFDIVTVGGTQYFVLLGLNSSSTYALTYIEKIFTKPEALALIEFERLTIVE